MNQHIINHQKAFGYQEHQPCERCGKTTGDMFHYHHIIFRSEKPKHPLLDHPVNILYLCGTCHLYMHQHKHTAREKYVKERKLKEIFS